MNDIGLGGGGGCGGGFIGIVILSGNQSSTKIDTVRDLCNVLSSLGITECILVLKVALTDKSKKTIESEHGSRVKIHYMLRSSVQYDWYNNMTQPLMAKVAKNECDLMLDGEPDTNPPQHHHHHATSSWFLEGIHSPASHQRYWDRPHVMKPTPRQSLNIMIGTATTSASLEDDDGGGNVWYSCSQNNGYRHSVSSEMVIVSSLMRHIIQTLYIQGAISISETDNVERIFPCNHVECQREGHDRAYRKFVLNDEESCAAMTREKQSSIFSSLQSLKNVNAIFAGYIEKRRNSIINTNNRLMLNDDTSPINENVEPSSTGAALEPTTSSVSLYKQVLGHLEPSVDYLPGIIPGPITTRFSLKPGDLLHSQRHTPIIHRMLRHFNKTGRGGRSNAGASSAQDDDDE